MSRIVHDEGATSGTDLTTGVKSYQVENAGKFRARWQKRLSEQFEPGRSVFLARERNVRRRVLVLDHCTPEPDKDAGSMLVLGTMRVLQSLGCKVTFVPEDNYLFLDSYTTDLERLGIECLAAPFVTSVEQYLTAHGHEFDVVLIFRFTAVARNLGAIRRHAPHAKVIFDTVDLHFLRESREGHVRADARITERAKRIKQDELAIIGRVDCTIVHNALEQALLARERPEAQVVLFGWTIDVPGTTVPFGPRHDIAFIGGYQHPPNVDAANYFASEVFPLVRRQLPDVRLHLVGSNPTAALRDLQSDSIMVRGFVPDLKALLDGVRVTVAPLRYGAGIKGKIATSLSHGVPCVTTPLGVEGMGLEHERDVLVAESSEALAAEVVRLYQDQALWELLSRNGMAFVRDSYSFDGARRVFADILRRLGMDPDDGGVPEATDGLEVTSISSVAQDRDYRERARGRFAERAAIERALIPSSERPFDIEGFCVACLRSQSFRTTFDAAVRDEQGARIPNWRENLVCDCGFNTRIRTAIHWLTLKVRLPKDARIYLMEQRSALYDWLKERYPNLVGSEYLGIAAPLGRSLRGIRNEDATRLTFSDGSLDCVLSFDVFEHVPDYRSAFHEAYRCLTDGGLLLFTAPFVRTSPSTIQRARLSGSGEIEHLLPPEYHGDPMNPDGGILCFQHFGWDVIEALKAAGFTEPHALFMWSRRLGYLGDEQVLFSARKMPRS
jgi:hypothetical protein